MMKRTFAIFNVALLGAALALPIMADTPANKRPQYGPNDRPVPLPVPQDVVEGEAYFLERIAIPPDSKLFVSLVGSVNGADYLPLASTITQARNGTTQFRLLVPQGMAPKGPYRLQAWVVANNRLIMNGANPQTTLNSLTDKARIRLKMASGLHHVSADEPAPAPATTTDTVRGTVTKRDRRAMLPDTKIEVTVSDVSLADAPAKVVGRQTIASEGKQVPFSFAVPINAADLVANHTYSLSVRVTEGGRLTYITDTPIPVTPENWNSPFTVNLTSVKRD